MRAPSVQKSEPRFDVQDGAVIYGLAGVKNVGRSVAEAIVAERRENGPYADLFDFCKRLGPQNINRRSLESLIMAGALDDLEGTRAQHFLAVPEALQFAGRQSGPKEQVSLFDLGGDDGGLEVAAPSLPDVNDWPFEEVLSKERDVLGMYFSGHPLDALRDDLEGLCMPLTQVAECDLETTVVVGGFVRTRRVRLNKDNLEFAFVELEDFSGSCEVAFWTESWKNCRAEVEEGRMILLRAKVRANRDRNEEAAEDAPVKKSLEGLRAVPLSEARKLMADSVQVVLDTRVVPENAMDAIKEACLEHPGTCRLVMQVRSPAGNWTLEAKAFKVNPTNELLEAIRSHVGAANVRVAAKGR